MGQRKIAIDAAGLQVADRVRKQRALLRLTLSELSARMTIAGRPTPRNSLTMIESGRRRVDADDLMALARSLSTSARWLLHGGDWRKVTEEHRERVTAALAALSACEAAGLSLDDVLSYRETLERSETFRERQAARMQRDPAYMARQLDLWGDVDDHDRH